MVKVETYGNLTKRQEDLFRLGYYYKSLAAITLLTTAEAVTFKARAAQKVDASVLASSSIKVTGSKITFTPKRRTDGLQQYTLEYTPSADLKIKGESKTTQTVSAKSTENTISVEYRQPSYAFKLALTDPNLSLRAIATAERDGNGLGFDCKFDVALQRFVNYNVALWTTEAKHSLVVKHNGSDKAAYSLGEFVVSYFNEPNSKTRLGAVVKYNVPKKDNFIEFGGDYRYDDNTILRAKINSLSFLSLGFTRQMNQYLKLGLASQFDLKKVKSAYIADYKFGIRLDFSA